MRQHIENLPDKLNILTIRYYYKSQLSILLEQEILKDSYNPPDNNCILLSQPRCTDHQDTQFEK